MSAPTRERWPSRLSFIFAAVGSAVGLGNVWRFPYLAGKYGGGAFLLPYLLILVALGIPLLIMEFAIGQRMQRAAPTAMKKVDAKFAGAGFGSILASFGVASYYAIVMAWSLLYLKHSFSLPWADDSKAFFFTDILNLSSGPGELGEFSLPILAALFIGWICVYFCIWKGVQSVSAVVNVTMPLPVILLVVLLIRGLTLPGAEDGISFYVTPDLSALLDIEVWNAAMTQIFFTLTLGFGVMIAYGSYQETDSDIAVNAISTAIINCSISILAGFTVFTTIGYMAQSAGVEVAELAATGPSLAFVVFPEALSLMPGAPYFAALFFVMLFTLAIDSLFSLMEAIGAVIHDALPNTPKEKSMFWLCVVGFLSGIIFTSAAGLYYLDIVDHYVTSYGLVGMGLLQCIAVGWFYGAKEMREYINEVSDIRIGAWWDVCIRYIAPACLVVLLGASLYRDLTIPYEGYPLWAQLTFGWSAVVLLFLACGVYSVLEYRKER